MASEGRTPLNAQQRAFAKRLRSFLEDHGISQSELARRLKVQPSAVNHWLLGGIDTVDARTELRMAKLDGKREMLSVLRERVSEILMDLDREILAATYEKAPTPEVRK